MTGLAQFRTRWGTWLALLAMCLLLSTPLVSQLRIAARAAAPDVSICSAGAAHHQPASPSMSACGYCDLLAMPAAPPPFVTTTVRWLPLLTLAPVIPGGEAARPLIQYFAGYPRAPPRCD